MLKLRYFHKCAYCPQNVVLKFWWYFFPALSYLLTNMHLYLLFRCIPL
jgi:hypothetical protein